MSKTAVMYSARTGGLTRVLWFAAPLTLFAVVLVRFTELSALLDVFAGASRRWLFAAGLLTAGYIASQAGVYRGIFRLLGAAVAFVDALSLFLVMAFASMALPAWTATGIAYFVAAARSRGVSGPQSLLAALGYYLFDWTSFAPLLVAGAVVMRAHPGVSPLPAGVLALFVLLIIGGTAAVVWGIVRPRSVRTMIAAVARWIGLLRPRHRASIAASAVALGRELQDVCAAVRNHPRRSLEPLVCAGLAQALGVALLWVVFVALDHRIAPGPLVAGYAVGNLFMAISITPSGVGVVESAMTLTLAAFGVPLEIAAAGTILFRLFTFWVPMVAGFFTWRTVR